ncbi:hypothetical protein ALC62_02419, partial [Cyphomyrmex costatus]
LCFNILDLSNSIFNDNSVEILGVELFSERESICIISIYRHPNCDTPMQFYDSLMGYITARGNCVLMGDFNAHHSHWGCSTSDRAGNRILAACENASICILSDLRPSLLLPPSSGHSVIDLILTTSDIAPLCEVSTEIDTWGSDHFPIRVEVGINPSQRKRFAYKLNLNNQELKNFAVALDDSFVSFAKDLPPDSREAYSSLSEHIIKTAVSCSSCPHKKASPGTVVIKSEKVAPP